MSPIIIIIINVLCESCEYRTVSGTIQSCYTVYTFVPYEQRYALRWNYSIRGTDMIYQRAEAFGGDQPPPRCAAGTQWFHSSVPSICLFTATSLAARTNVFVKVSLFVELINNIYVVFVRSFVECPFSKTENPSSLIFLGAI